MKPNFAQVMIRGKFVAVDSVQVGKTIIVCSGKLFKTARIEDEWYEDADHPELIIDALKRDHRKPDIFTFWQRFPETSPKYNYYMEWESLAALKIESYEYWYKKQIDTNARRAIKKAEKNGIVVKIAQYDEIFIKGMVDIFNETPIRQGRPFWHYGKDFQTVEREFSRYLYREDLLGAYLNGEMVGFMFLANAGRYVLPGQILSKNMHRDKAINNALISKAVELCANRNIPYFIYFNWGDTTLAEFKRRNGFNRVDIPRYYVPLTTWGKAIMKLQLHRGVIGILPARVMQRLRGIRKMYYETKYRHK